MLHGPGERRHDRFGGKRSERLIGKAGAKAETPPSFAVRLHGPRRLPNIKLLNEVGTRRRPAQTGVHSYVRWISAQWWVVT